MNDPEPMDDKLIPEVEVRGGDRPEDYIPDEEGSGGSGLIGWDLVPTEVPPTEAAYIDPA